MANILTVQELQGINNAMLGKGAPVVIDGTGYNKLDWGRMEMLSYKGRLTNKEAYILSNTLVKYTKTQLVGIADDILATAKSYKEATEVEAKAAAKVKVITFNGASVTLSWGFNKVVQEYIKGMATADRRWSKDDNNNWLLSVQWSAVDGLLDAMQGEGLDISAVMELKNTNKKAIEEEAAKPVEIKEFKVERDENGTDTLIIHCSYDKKLVEAFHKTPFTFFTKASAKWTCYIDQSAKLYDELVKAGIQKKDIKALKPWADLVRGWEKKYNLVDVNSLPLQFKPYDFQPVDCQRLLDLQAGINGNEMGTGKTFESVLIGESLPMKKLVICPPSLRINWRKEIKMVNPKANVHIIYSSDKFEAVDGWNIIGYTSCDKFCKELEKELFQCVFMDEAHFIQAVSNSGKPESKRAKAVLRIAATSQFVFPITGTPKTNRNKNLFNILKAVRHPLTRGNWAFMDYGKKFCEGHNYGYGWDFSGNSNDELLYEEITPVMVRHLKKEVLPNLKKQRILTPVEVDLREYKREIAEYMQQSKKANQLASLGKAKKILAVKKVPETIDFARTIINEDKKVVIVTCFTEVVRQVEEAFKGNVTKIVGGMSDAQKDASIEEFQKGSTQVMVMNIVAGGVGVTLTAAYNMIINDFDWTPGNLVQAEDRICRGGQTELCNVYYLYAEGADMDEILADTLTNKFETINDAIDGGNGDAIDYYDLLNKALEEKKGRVTK